MISYVDASVLLRVILGEAGQLATWREITPVSSELVRVECLRVIDRARLAFGLDDETVVHRRTAILEALQAFGLAGVSRSVLERAGDPFPVTLGTLDAIHLATALQLRDEFPGMRFATHDVELGLAARSVGFEVHGL